MFSSRDAQISVIFLSAEARGCSNRQMACLSTLYLFSKIKPDLMVQHVTTLQPYLEIKCSVSILTLDTVDNIDSNMMLTVFQLSLQIAGSCIFYQKK